MIRYLRKDHDTRTTTWQQLAELHPLDDKGTTASALTVKRALNMAGYYTCKACQKSWLLAANVEARYTSRKVLRNRTMNHWR